MLELHFCAAPNPAKVTIMLKELGCPYELKFYSAVQGEHFTHEFFEINLNRKLPCWWCEEKLGRASLLSLSLNREPP